MTTNTNTIMERVQEGIKAKATRQANDEAEALRTDLNDLLAKHGITDTYGQLVVGGGMARIFEELRAERLRQEMEFQAAQRILGEDWGRGG